MVESAAFIGEIICRYAVFEDVYLQYPSAATDELRRALVRFYAAIMIYLSKVRRYFEQSSASSFRHSIFYGIYLDNIFIERVIKSGLLAKSDIESYFNEISTAQDIVDRCSSMVEMQGKLLRQDFCLLYSLIMNLEQINQHKDLKRLLECIDGPIERMSADLVSIKDDIECKFSNSTPESQLMSLSVKENGNSTLDVFRTIHPIS